MHFNSIYYLNCLKTSVDEGKGWIDRKGRKEENKKELKNERKKNK